MEKDKKEKKVRKPAKWLKNRFSVIVLVLFIAFAVVGIRLFWIHFTKGNDYSQAALSQSETDSATITAKRGDILDRNRVQLATSTIVYDLILDPRVILSDAERYQAETVALIEQCFGIPASELNERIAANPESSYQVLKKGLTYSEVEEFIKLRSENKKVAGVFLMDNYKRNYAYDTMACSVIGFMSSNNVGDAGLEYRYNDVLTGTDGREYTYVNSDNVLETVRRDAVNGNTILTTLDYNIQSIVENKIAEFLKNIKAKTVAVLIQDPDTGEILAMADSDNFNCNKPRDLTLHYSPEEIAKMSDADVTEALSQLWMNYCITASYEPGSTYKPFTLAAGLETQTVSLNDEYNCEGYLHFLDADVSCHNIYGHGYIDTRMAIAESCNVALMEMSQAMGPTIFSKYQHQFGFGASTGIDLPNEVSCSMLLYNAKDMSVLDLATNSFGQNFNLTMIQMSTAFCSLINGGYLYKPYIVKSIYNDTGDLVQSRDKILVARTISEDTSESVKRCMRAVVTEGTGIGANVPGYVISGKTGTGEKRGREDGIYLISFIGFAPFDHPEVVCYVIIDEPETGDQEGVSTGLWHSIMEEVLPYMNIKGYAEDTDPDGVAGTDAEYDPDYPDGRPEEEYTGEEAYTEEEYYEEPYEEYNEEYYEEEYYEEEYYEEEPGEDYYEEET